MAVMVQHNGRHQATPPEPATDRLALVIPWAGRTRHLVSSPAGEANDPVRLDHVPRGYPRPGDRPAGPRRCAPGPQPGRRVPARVAGHGLFQPDAQRHRPAGGDAAAPLARHEVRLGSHPAGPLHPPAPIEVSFLSRGDLLPWRFPTPFQLHYSERWRQHLEQETQNTTWLPWSDEPQYDGDLAAHLTVTRGRGVVLSGPAIVEVLPSVPAADYIAAVVADSETAMQAVVQEPVSVVLNLCRVYCTVEANRVSSKDEAGKWALPRLSAGLRGVVEQALAAYHGEPVPDMWDSERLQFFVHELQARIHSRLAGGPALRSGQQLTFHEP